jgi:predicted DNA-binding antitoxin AbrB/MazE fold protein
MSVPLENSMSQIVTAIYENGVLKPTAPLELENGAAVRLTVDALASEESGSASEISQFVQSLRDSKDVDPLPADYDFLRALNANRATGEGPLFPDPAPGHYRPVCHSGTG